MIKIIFFLQVLILSGVSFAETIPATITNTAPVYTGSKCGSTASTAEAACNENYSCTAFTDFTARQVVALSSTVFLCQWQRASLDYQWRDWGTATLSCPSGTLENGQCVGYTCPPAFVISGTAPNQVCTASDCVSPQVRNTTTGICEAPPPVCVLEAVGPSGYFKISSIESYTPLEGCYQGCLYAFYDSTPGFAHSSIENGVKTYYDLGDYYGMGVACTGTTPNLPAAQPNLPAITCPGGYTATTFSWGVECTNNNGTSTPDGPVVAPTITTSATNPSVVQQTAPGSPIATTSSGTSTTSTNPDGTTTTTSTTTTLAPEFPSDLAKTGEAASAAVTITDKLESIYQFINAPVDPIASPADSDTQLQNQERAVNAIIPVSVGGAGVCPADQSITIAGITKHVSYVTYCNFAEGIRPIILLFAWLAAAGILIGGFKQK